MSVPKRIDWVKRKLLAREDLTHKHLIGIGGGWRLAAAIYYLRHKAKPKWPIKTFLDHRRIAHYRLPPGWVPEKTDIGVDAATPKVANAGALKNTDRNKDSTGGEQ